MDNDRLHRFMRDFFGYGSWSAPLWFVGMEEGGSGTPEELEKRLAAWDGTSNLADLRKFHKVLGGRDWFGDRAPLQSTWSKLIRATLCAQGSTCTTANVRSFQREHLGSTRGIAALIELLPLPSRSIADWRYDKLPELATRENYKEAMVDIRIATLRSRVKEHKPRAVVFYGKSYRSHWEQVASSTFEVVEGQTFETAGTGPLFILAPHPTALGTTNSAFCAIGRHIADRVGHPLSRPPQPASDRISCIADCQVD